MFVVHNFLVVPEYMFQMNYKNRAFQYGDGFFETMIFDPNKKVRFYDDHFARIMEAIEVFKFQTPLKFSKDALHQLIADLVDKNAIQGEARVKLMLYRKEGGLFVPSNNEFELLITASPRSIPSTAAKFKVEFYDEYPVQLNPVSRFKTLSALSYVFAGVFAQQHNLDDVVLLNDKGKIAECLYTNIYWVKNDTIYTPSIKTGCVSGVMRKQVLSLAQGASIQVVQGEFDKDHLLDADFAFNSNVTGFFVLQNIEGVNLKSDHPVYETIKEEVYKSY